MGDSESRSEVDVNSIIIPKKVIVVVSAIIVVSLLLALYIFSSSHGFLRPSPQITNNITPILPRVIHPNNDTAYRYYNIVGKSDWYDFRPDGSTGDFILQMTKNNGFVIVQWDEDVKASSIDLYDVGKLYDLTDQKKVYSDTVVHTRIAAHGMVVASIEGSIRNPYQIGELSSPSVHFIKGHRYSIDVYGTKGEKSLWAAYTFNY